MELAAVVFDMDGLMLETETLYKASWQRAAIALGYELDDEFYLTLVGRANSECEVALLARFGTEFPLAEFRSRWSRSWRTQAETSGISAKPGLVELLSFLEQRGVPVAVATSSDAQYAEFSLRAAALGERFETVVTGDTVSQGKPAPDIYLEAARRLGVVPTDCIALEDSDAGVMSASQAGMLALMIPDLKPPSREAARAAFRVLGSLYDARRVIGSLLGATDEAG